MDQVRKTYFHPLATSKAQIRSLLQGLPIGSAHPYSPEKVLLCQTHDGVQEIDISSLPEDFFFNAVDLGEMGEILLQRMACFPSHLSGFQDFQIMQATASTFKVPIVHNRIAILAVSELKPTYWDFCFGDANKNTCCWIARNTFKGMTHSGDIIHNNTTLLDYVTLDKEDFITREIGVFISGYRVTPITKFLGTNPALLVADHVEKILYIIPVPLDPATIGEATLCCPLVIKREGDSLVCSILPTASTERGMMCHDRMTVTPMFAEAIKRANFTIKAPQRSISAVPGQAPVEKDDTAELDALRQATLKDNVVLTTSAAALPRQLLDMDRTQVIEFGTGLDFKLTDKESKTNEKSSVVLPCVFGSQLEGPLLLATGRAPSNVPFLQDTALLSYYQERKSVVLVVDDRMTDNARNLATRHRINAVFVVQLEGAKSTDDIPSLLNSANINAVTALAGPVSLILVQVSDKYYFYRGVANKEHMNTSKMAFATEVTSVVTALGLEALADPRAKRIVNLDDEPVILLPSTGQLVKPQDLASLFDELSIDQINGMDEDIAGAVPQIQAVLNQKDLQQLSRTLVGAVTVKIGRVTGPLRQTYIDFLANGFDASDPEAVKKKNALLGKLRKTSKKLQKDLEPAITQLTNMMSSQTTSKRTHDLKRLVRQTKIAGNVEAVKSMTFETLEGYLAEHAADMGVMLINIESTPYRQLLTDLPSGTIDATLDSRMVHLDGLSAGIIMEQAQTLHDGPLRSISGPSQPTLALPRLSQGDYDKSMLAWVCWDEFVDLESPYKVRWMEKCNDAHIAAARILMRGTLSQAVTSREHNLVAESPVTAQLMSALLMATMGKLAAMRSTPPPVVAQAEDTVTRLMRGLFGNLLTTAGSGVRPMSMVWQLLGQDAKYDVPTSGAEWTWYEAVAALFPYTAWPPERFHQNLDKFLDKVIVRTVTKNENVAEIKSGRIEEMVKFCKLRNIQLAHSRTIITIFMRMLVTDGADVVGIATRLLEHLPHTLKRQTESYKSMIAYLQALSAGGERRVRDDTIAASVYTKRSAAFAELKTRVSRACEDRDVPEIKRACQALLDKHTETAELWRVPPAKLGIHNLRAYRDLMEADFDDGADAATKNKTRQVIARVTGDAEVKRVPWQVQIQGSEEKVIEPLDEAFVEEVITGKAVVPVADPGGEDKILEKETVTEVGEKQKDPFEKFKSTTKSGFIDRVQKGLTPKAVCELMQIPVTVMRQFSKTLNPDFVWDDLGGNYKEVLLELLEQRSEREGCHPARKLLGLKKGGQQLLTQNVADMSL